MVGVRNTRKRNSGSVLPIATVLAQAEAPDVDAVLRRMQPVAMVRAQFDRHQLWATPPPTIDGRAFHGQWANKYWKNIPGPFYSTTLNMMSLLAFGNETKSHLLYDDS
jgi:hypothetical protein